MSEESMARSSYWLEIREGVAQGRKVDLRAGPMIIGRDPACDIIIESPAVSRRHARIEVQGDRVTLEDLGSSNGTFIGVERITNQAELKPGDQFSISRTIQIELQSFASQVTVLNPNLALPKEESLPSSQKTVLGSAAIPPQIQPPQIEVTIAGQKPETYSLFLPVITLGRLAGSDILISSPIVSRKQAVLQQIPIGYQVEPNPEATNPLYFEGRPLVANHLLQHGELFRIGGEDPGLMVTIRYLNPASAGVAAPQVVDFQDKERLTVGRDPSNDLVLKSPQVSRYHASIERIGQRFRVTDLRSANGTFINDRRIEGTIWLQPNDTFRIGPNRFILGEVGISHAEETNGLRVEAVRLNKWVRKDLNLLKDLSLIFQPREFVVVVGQSGGGKSTLVDAIAGYRPATGGRVLVNGIDVYHNFDAIRNEIGFVPQKDIIHFELTVYQALDFAARLRMPADTSQEERQARIVQVLEDLDLTHRKDVQISGLSGGQQKRVSIGVELLTQPGLFFLDEPTSGLDPGTETALMHLMRRLADQGRTIILITHATKNVMLADKVVFLARGGYLAWFGPPDEALAYFDQYRSERDRRAKAIEFDEIYAILDDPSRGSPEEWASRYRQHQAYQSYIVQPLHEFGHDVLQEKKRDTPTTKPQDIQRQRTKNQISGLRQFFILSARNMQILVRDRPSLVLMLAVAPILSLLDVILSFVLGRDLFNFTSGNMASVVTSMFMPIMYSIMVGALAQMREFVKEADIYRRERLVNLKVLPYILSKVWVAAILALYQALVYVAVHYLAFKMPGGTNEFLTMYASLYLATLAGMMLGLASSALAPNANAVPLIVILFLVPQFVLGGAMIPVPDYISAPTSARWAFEAELAISGVGSDLAADICWALPENLREQMTVEMKQANGCRCMGISALKQNSCNFPGAGIYYDPIVDQAEPQPPPELGKPPADPVIPPAPQAPGQNPDNVEMATYLLALKDYQKEVDKIQTEYKNQMQAYQARADQFKDAATSYQKALTEWKIKRNSAVGEAEGIMKAVYKDFKWTFVDKRDPAAYWTLISSTWISQGTIILILLILSILLIWRKDRL
ncbi:MAG TPA: FHA domain-containing protein [Anaerolineaceae bacterium]|nr:FHA domain-containing protein [Anaerolineaceae bacterium]